ncbi:hypothetical protein D3C81_1472010 [compost metagenome]
MKYAKFDESGGLLTRYDSAVHGVMPVSGYVELSEEMFAKTISETDGVWMLGADGTLYNQPIPLTVEQRARCERTWRDEQVSATEWLVNRYRDEQDMRRTTTLSSGQFSELLTYRQSLRDWPQSEAFLDIQARPLAPSWLANQTQ